MRRFLLAAAVVLGGCATVGENTNEKGRAALDQGDYRTAERLFLECAQQGTHQCMFNLGFMWDHNYLGADPDKAITKRWLTLAARYGSDSARVALVNLGAPVPPADLVAATGPTATEAMAVVLESYNAARASQPIVIQQPARATLSCTSYKNGATVQTDCK